MAALITLAASLALYGAWHTEERSTELKNGVEWVLRMRQVPKADEGPIRDDLLRAAGADRSVRSSVLFAGEAATLLERASKYKDFFSFMRESELAWEGLAALDRHFVRDGSAPAVRYEIGNRPDANWFRGGEQRYRDSGGALRLEREYGEVRQLGLKPDAAWKRISDRSFGEGHRRTIEEVRYELEREGEWALTSYNATEAERDTPAFLEACYAFRHPNAPDVKAVVPAESPTQFIGHRVTLAIKSDMTHMLRAADRVIDATEARLAAARKPRPAPVAATSAPATLSLFPNSNWVRAPGANRPAEPVGYVLDPLTIEGYAFRCFEGKQAVSPTERRGFTESKYLATCPVAPGHRRGGYHDFNGYYRNGSWQSMLPNTNYDVIAYPWYWAPKAESAFLVWGDMNGNPWDQVQSPPAQGRVNLPASQGQVFEVRVRVRTDATGRFRLILCQPDVSAINLGLWYVKPA